MEREDELGPTELVSVDQNSADSNDQVLQQSFSDLGSTFLNLIIGIRYGYYRNSKCSNFLTQ